MVLAEQPSAPRPSWIPWLIVMGLFVALPLGYVGYKHLFGGVTAYGPSVEQQIVARYSEIPGTHVNLTAHCPATFQLRKGKIVDCTLVRDDNEESTKVFLTGADNSGHFSMQIENPFLVVAH